MMILHDSVSVPHLMTFLLAPQWFEHNLSLIEKYIDPLSSLCNAIRSEIFPFLQVYPCSS